MHLYINTYIIFKHRYKEIFYFRILFYLILAFCNITTQPIPKIYGMSCLNKYENLIFQKTTPLPENTV